MADVAIISVISSGVVGVLGTASAVYGQCNTLQNEREKRIEARRDDLRGVLDEAATFAMGFLRPFGDAEATTGKGSSEIFELAADFHKVQARVGIRLGTDSGPSRTLAEVLGGVQLVFYALHAVPSDRTLAQLAHAANESPAAGEAYQRAEDAIEQLNRLTAAFLNAASDLVGAQ